MTKTFKPGRGYTKADWDAVDSPPLTKEELANGKPFKEVFPDLYDQIQRGRGRPKLPDAKVAITLRLSPATVEKFKAGGEDWRARMSKTLEKARG